MGHLYAKLIDSPLPGILLDPEEPWMTPSSPIWHTQILVVQMDCFSAS